MIRGISITFNKNNIVNLFSILKGTSVFNLQLYVKDGEFYSIQNGKFVEDLFDYGSLSGDDFLEKLKQDHYIIRIIVYGFNDPVCGDIVIKDYNDYYNSECIFVLICSDTGFFDIYSKDINVVNTIRQNCIESNLSYEVLDKTTDSRTSFSMC